MICTLVDLTFALPLSDLIVLQLVRPYKRKDVNFIAIATQVSLVCVFMGATFLKFYNRLSESYSNNDAEEITGFSSGHRIVIAMLTFNLSVLFFIGTLTFYQYASVDSLRSIRLISTNQVPELGIAGALKYHLFLSHTWSSGQDQMAVVKRQLQLLLPGIRVFLDVDDLDSVDVLEGHIEASQSVLTFLSRGYFFSTNVQRELRASHQSNKPLVLLHESDMKRGGMPLAQLKLECPQSNRLGMRDFVFDGREVILWLRVRAFQVISLKMIVSLVLEHAAPIPQASPTATPPDSPRDSNAVRGQSSPIARLRKSLGWNESPVVPPGPARNEPAPLGSELYIPGDEISRKRLTFVKPTTIIISANNPGAAEVAEELRARQVQLSIASYADFQLALETSTSFSRGTMSLSQRLRQLPMHAQLRVERLKRLKRLASTQEFFLLYLDASTWEGEEGSLLSDEVMEVMKAGYNIILLHEQDPQRGSCEFERFLQACIACHAH